MVWQLKALTEVNCLGVAMLADRHHYLTADGEAACVRGRTKVAELTTVNSRDGKKVQCWFVP
jgi:hypothetical protein